MRSPNNQCDKTNFFDLTARELDEMMVSWGWPKFRGDQLRDWVYRKGADSAEQMTNLSKADRAKLAERISFASATIAKEQHSSDGTIKLLLNWENGASAETVMIP